MLWTIAGVLTILWILGDDYIHHPWWLHPYFDCDRYYCTGDTVLQAEKINHSIFVVTVFCAADASSFYDTSVFDATERLIDQNQCLVWQIQCAIGW